MNTDTQSRNARKAQAAERRKAWMMDWLDTAQAEIKAGKSPQAGISAAYAKSVDAARKRPDLADDIRRTFGQFTDKVKAIQRTNT